ncbi:hypothetical protein ABFS83_04G067500 [Erythranthe nasuta]
MGNKFMYERRSIKKNADPLDFHTMITSSLSSSDRVFIKEVPMERPTPYARPKRVRKPKYDSSEWELSSPSLFTCRQSRRIPNATSALRGRLHDTLFDHCFRNIRRESSEEKKNPCTYLSCYWFYMYTNDSNREKVLGWIKKRGIFSKRYVFVPIVLWSHWSLLIFCNFGGSSPCMLLLDSLHTLGPLRLETLIRRLVLDIYETEDRPEDRDIVEKIPLLVPKVPQQRNGNECGVFVLYYINLFLESAPQSFSISSGYPYFMREDWFTEEELERFYDRLEFLGIESSDSE